MESSLVLNLEVSISVESTPSLSNTFGDALVRRKKIMENSASAMVCVGRKRKKKHMLFCIN